MMMMAPDDDEVAWMAALLVRQAQRIGGDVALALPDADCRTGRLRLSTSSGACACACASFPCAAAAERERKVDVDPGRRRPTGDRDRGRGAASDGSQKAARPPSLEWPCESACT